MKLLTKELTAKLNRAGYANTKPICKLFVPWGRATWLITSIDQDGIVSGWADLGMGCVEHGGIATIEELEAIRGPFGLRIERDLYWEPVEGDVEYGLMESLIGA
jgi:hypothetical protein